MVGGECHHRGTGGCHDHQHNGDARGGGGYDKWHGDRVFEILAFSGDIRQGEFAEDVRLGLGVFMLE